MQNYIEFESSLEVLYLNLHLKARLWLMQLAFQVRESPEQHLLSLKFKQLVIFESFRATFMRKVSFKTVRPT